MRVAAYVYPGWHPIAERDQSFYPGFTEWDLLAACQPRFPGHAQPRRPALGRYDDRDPHEVGRRLRLAAEHGIDALIYGFFWCRGKRVFQEALDLGLLGSPEGQALPFALMWANRMPRRVLPVRRADAPVIDPLRLVPSDVADFVALITYLGQRYFLRPNYLRVADKPYFSIFDSSFFLRELGLAQAAEAIRLARAALQALGLPGLHLCAIEPAADVAPHLLALGFDSVSNYVLLPTWRGPFQQDYQECALRRAAEWAGISRACSLPYTPSVSPGWDASPRGADFGPERPDKYPWSPVVVGERPALFQASVARAARYVSEQATPEQLVFIASLNEWTEGHYLEPDERFGTGWLEAVREGRGG